MAQHSASDFSLLSLLSGHNPVIDWSTATISSWSKHWHANCSSVLPEEINLSKVPSDEHDLVSKDCAQSFPPHHPYDYAIDLLVGPSLPTKKLYNISLPERQAMDKYLTVGLTHLWVQDSS